MAVLNMKTEKVPSYNDLKKAYHDLLHLHPDKTGPGEENTKRFQEITEAVRIVFLFLTNNPDLQPKRGSAECKRLLKCFEQSNKVEYKDGSIIFLFDDDQYDDWMKALEMKIGPASKLPSNNSFMFNTKKLEIPDHPNLGSVTASLYYKPKKDGKSKIMLQGTAYIAFLSFVIPDILKEYIKTKPLELKEVDIVSANNDGMKDDTNEAEMTNKKSVKIQEVDIKALVSGFDKLQTEMVSLRKELVRAVDDSQAELKDRLQLVPSKKDIENLEKVVNSNSDELSSLQDKLDRVIATQEKLGPVNSASLEQFISDGRTIFSKLRDISSIQMAANTDNGGGETLKMDNKTIEGLVKDNKSLIDKLEEVRETTNSLKEDIKSRDKAVESAVDNTAKIIPVITALEKQVTTLVNSLNPSPTFQPSVRPKEVDKKDPPTDGSKMKSNESESEEKSEPKIVEITFRKGVFMSSSIGLKLDMYDLQEKLESDVTSVNTYHIEKHDQAKNPEMYLKKNLKQLEGEKDLDFVIIATGTNDITALDVENEEMSELIHKACNQSRNLVQLADEAAQKHNVDVFVVERPPRGDTDKNYSVINDAANGLFPSLIAPLKKVHYIPLPSLQNMQEKSKKNLFTNIGVPVHLKPWGLKHLRNDIVAGVKSVYQDLQTAGEGDEKESVSKDGKRKYQPEERSKMFQQDGPKSFHDINTSKPQDAGVFQPPGRKNYNDAVKSGDRHQREENRHEYGQGNQPNGRFGNNEPFNREYPKRNSHPIEETLRPDSPPFPKDGGKFKNQGRFERELPYNRGGGDNRHGNRGNSRDYSGRGQQQSNNHRGQSNSNHSQPQHRGYPDRQSRGGGQQEGQMPEMVKQYLLNTLMNNENQRY